VAGSWPFRGRSYTTDDQEEYVKPFQLCNLRSG
jgi:hypothetical protein